MAKSFKLEDENRYSYCFVFALFFFPLLNSFHFPWHLGDAAGSEAEIFSQLRLESLNIFSLAWMTAGSKSEQRQILFESQEV